jgi:hypothetical protein
MWPLQSLQWMICHCFVHMQIRQCFPVTTFKHVYKYFYILTPDGHQWYILSHCLVDRLKHRGGRSRRRDTDYCEYRPHSAYFPKI